MTTVCIFTLLTGSRCCHFDPPSPRDEAEARIQVGSPSDLKESAVELLRCPRWMSMTFINVHWSVPLVLLCISVDAHANAFIRLSAGRSRVVQLVPRSTLAVSGCEYEIFVSCIILCIHFNGTVSFYHNRVTKKPAETGTGKGSILSIKCFDQE
jgi:hypothetical protein